MKLAGLALSCACTPAPLSGIVIGEPGALLVTDMLPEALPVAVGANVAVKVALLPALIVTGMLKPLMLKPAPDALAWVIVNGAFPVFCKMTLFFFCGRNNLIELFFFILQHRLFSGKSFLRLIQ